MYLYLLITDIKKTLEGPTRNFNNDGHPPVCWPQGDGNCDGKSFHYIAFYIFQTLLPQESIKVVVVVVVAGGPKAHEASSSNI